MHVSRSVLLPLIGSFISVVMSGVSMSRAAIAQNFQTPEDVAFLSKRDATEQRYVVLLPESFQSDRQHDLMIALHGHGSDRWQFVNDTRPECRGARDVAVQRNMIYVSPDYRAKTSWMGPSAVADLLQILDELHGRFRIRHVVIGGGSMGGTSAFAFAAMHPECIDGAVSLNGTANLVEYPNFPDAIAESFGGSKADRPEIYRERSAEFFPERLTMPVAATTGGQDTLVPPDSTLRLTGSLKTRGTPVLSIHRPDGGHSTNYEDTVAAFRFVLEKLDSKLASPAPPVLSSLEKETTIVCLGDSVTGVYYHTGGQRAFPEMLELALRKADSGARVRVINAGISGHTTNEGLARLESDVLKHHPTLVSISFGLNDMTRVPPDQFRNNLEVLIDRCRAQNSAVVLCTPNAVIDTTSRPIKKLMEYCDIIRSVGRDRMVPVCDQYEAGARLRSRAPWTWRLTMSDEIHPNMDGHKRMAEELCSCICGRHVSLDEIEPPEPALARTQSQLADRKPVKVFAMEPVSAAVDASLRQWKADATVDMTSWSIAGKSLAELEQEANARVRAMKPDLVVLTIPDDSAAENEEQFVHAVSWIMNWSLSFGHQEWDCIVVHPSVLNPSADPARAALVRKLVHAQHLHLIDRVAGDTATADDIIQRWIESHR
jgi:lysophospholipase L1-like esterase/pimeloyl-ACP methyl ester carboxylesterase